MTLSLDRHFSLYIFNGLSLLKVVQLLCRKAKVDVAIIVGVVEGTQKAFHLCKVTSQESFQALEMVDLRGEVESTGVSSVRKQLHEVVIAVLDFFLQAVGVSLLQTASHALKPDLQVIRVFEPHTVDCSKSTRN